MHARTRTPRALEGAAPPAGPGGNLEPFVGSWEGPELHYGFSAEPTAGSCRGRFTMRMLGAYLILEYQRERDWRVCFRGHGMLAWDPPSEAYALAWVDTGGEGFGPLALGHWREGELCLEQETPTGVLRYLFALADRDLFSFWIDRRPMEGEEWDPVMQGEYRKVRR